MGKGIEATLPRYDPDGWPWCQFLNVRRESCGLRSEYILHTEFGPLFACRHHKNRGTGEVQVLTYGNL